MSADPAPPAGTTPRRDDVEVFDVALDDDPGSRTGTGRQADHGDGPAANGAGPRRRGPGVRAMVAITAIGLDALVVVSDPFASDTDDGATTATSTTTLADLAPPPTLELRAATAPPPTTTTTTFVRDEDLHPSAAPSDLELTRIDLFAAVGTNRLDRPRRTTTSVTVGERGFDLTVELTSDPTSGRIGLEMAAGANERRGVIDPGRNEAYALISPGVWSSYPLPRRDGERWGRLLLGPIDSGLLARAAALDGVRAGPTVEHDSRDDGPVATRVFAVSTTAASMPTWVPYALGPQGGAAPRGDEPIDLRVLVDARERIREVSWAVRFGNTHQIVVHRIDYPPRTSNALPGIATL